MQSLVSTTALLPVQTRSDVAVRVSHALRLAIVGGEMEDGQRLVPETIAAQLGVSRPPVMEAMRRLAREGLISIGDNGRPYVIGLTHKFVDDLYRFRLVLDEQAVAVCLGRVPARAEEELRALVSRMVDHAGDGNLSGVADLDLQFHTVYLRLADNQFVLNAWHSVSDLAHAFLTVTDRLVLDLHRIARIHEAIMDGLCSGDEAAAQSALRMHYQVGFGVIGGNVAER